MDLQKLAEVLPDIAEEAGRAILDVYNSDYEVEYKYDDSPLTTADKASNAVIMKRLAESFPNIPVLSEEGREIPFEERKVWKRFFCVDPMDGTKEFIKRNGEFSVCIGYVEFEQTRFGVVHAPVLQTTWWGGRDFGAFRRSVNEQAEEIDSKRNEPGEGHIVVGSLSHPSPDTDAFLKTVSVGKFIAAGSAIKFCRLAEGSATLYPRFNPTMEWDTCAGQAILEGAGGSLTNWDGSPFTYNKDSLRNPGFLAKAWG